LYDLFSKLKGKMAPPIPIRIFLKVTVYMGEANN